MCALLEPRIVDKWGIRPFVCHRLCMYTCVRILASRNPLDHPYIFCTGRNRSLTLSLQRRTGVKTRDYGNNRQNLDIIHSDSLVVERGVGFVQSDSR